MLKEKLTRVAGKAALKIKKVSPELLLVAGTAAVIGGVVLCCKATLKLNDILDDATNTLDKIDEVEKTHDNYSEDDANHDRVLTKAKCAINIARTYLPGVALIGIGVTCFYGSHHILRKRNIALMATVKGLTDSFNQYRENVRKTFGEEADQSMLTGAEYEVTKDEEGNEVVNAIHKNEPSIYAKFFDEFNASEWVRDANKNLLFLRTQERYANDMLRARGHVFLNEVYDMLGIPRTPAGAVVGWVYGSKGDNRISFGIYDTERPGGLGAADFVNGRTESILLDFNVDGVIYDLI